jgi:hypothetical protein
MRPIDEHPGYIEVRVAFRKSDGVERSVHGANLALRELVQGPQG